MHRARELFRLPCSQNLHSSKVLDGFQFLGGCHVDSSWCVLCCSRFCRCSTESSPAMDRSTTSISSSESDPGRRHPSPVVNSHSSNRCVASSSGSLQFFYSEDEAVSGESSVEGDEYGSLQQVASRTLPPPISTSAVQDDEWSTVVKVSDSDMIHVALQLFHTTKHMVRLVMSSSTTVHCIFFVLCHEHLRVLGCLEISKL